VACSARAGADLIFTQSAVQRHEGSAGSPNRPAIPDTELPRAQAMFDAVEGVVPQQVWDALHADLVRMRGLR
jgi:hypothetical protein